MSNIFDPKIIRSSRSSLSIQISRSGEVIVKAPRLVPAFVVKKFVESKKDWIEKTLNKINSRKLKAKQYKNGE